MQGSLGNILADYGFNFFEKIHEPIFLVDRSGRIKRINEAGRKFLKISNLSNCDLEAFSCLQFNTLFPDPIDGFKRAYVGAKRRVLIARCFEDCNYILVELHR